MTATKHDFCVDGRARRAARAGAIFDRDVVWLPVRQISTRWAEAQRPFDPKWAAKLAEDFDPDKMGVIWVCKLPGEEMYHAIDGQHRTAAVRLWGDDGQRVPCIVLPAATPERAADLFNAMNTARKTVKTVEVFRVRVTAGIDPEAAVNRAIESLGYHVENGGGPGTIRAVAACVSVWSKHGELGLVDALKLLRNAWGRDAAAVEANLIRGAGTFLATHGEGIDRAHLAAKIAREGSPGQIIGRAKGVREMFGGSLADGVARVLAAIYNRGRKHGRIAEGPGA